MAITRETGYDKISLCYDTRANIIANVSKMNTLEVAIATDTGELFFKDLSGKAEKITNQDLLTAINNCVLKSAISSSVISTATNTVANSYAVKQAYDKGQSAINSLASYIPNSKKSSSVSSTSNDTIATSGAVKVAYDKGVEALRNVSGKWDNSNCPMVMGTNGYQRLASGLLIQWGHFHNPTAAYYTIPLPTAFKNTNYKVIANWGKGYAAAFQGWGTLDYKTTSFRTGTHGANWSVDWIAIGE